MLVYNKFHKPQIAVIQNYNKIKNRKMRPSKLTQNSILSFVRSFYLVFEYESANVVDRPRQHAVPNSRCNQ